jgi:gliding motility-associated-like protein
MLKKATLIVFLLLVRYMAFADVFVVTSNADSGPGTLREALTLAAANDSTQTDYIHFNLPDITEAGRTINLTTQLPDVSSNLVIDGSTQLGATFGRSSAKVMLAFRIVPNMGFIGLRTANKHDVAVYGLYINLLTDLTNAGYLHSYSAIDFTNCTNIKVGALGKGNVFNGFPVPFSTNLSPYYGYIPCNNLIIKDSFFGIAPDGETLGVNQAGQIDLKYIGSGIHIGGAIGEGNLCTQGINISQQSYDDPNDPDNRLAEFIIKNNIIGTDINYKITSKQLSGISVNSNTRGNQNEFRIEDNVIAANAGYGIMVSNIKQRLFILRNYINTDKTLQKDLRGAQTGLLIRFASQVNIGSANPADANYITQCKPLRIETNSRVAINKNSIYCADTSTPAYVENTMILVVPPEVNILSATTNLITGTATPNAVVELFYNDACETCSPESYFTSVMAGADGNWQYSGLMTGKVIASATLNNATSEFTRARVNFDNIRATDACGGQGGALTGAVVRNAQTTKWLNEAGVVVGTNVDLVNVPPGRYNLIVDNGICTDESRFYPIGNAGVGLNATNVIIKKASCSQSDGAITGITSNVTGAEVYKWTNENGIVVGTSIDLTGVPMGLYTLNISARGNPCPENYGPVMVANTTGPTLNQTNAILQPTNCGQTTGSITGITATGTGTLKYIWKNAAQDIIATTPDLTNQPAGQYRLSVTDDSACGSVLSNIYLIPQTNGITLDDAGLVITSSSCNTDNGSVKGIVVSGATSYKWVNAGNVTVATTADLLNSAAGTFTFTASNTFGCVQTKTYTISQQSLTQYPSYTASTKAACFGTSNGAIAVTVDNKVMTVRWVNSQNTTVGTASSVNNLAAGSYRFYVTDANGCETLYKTYDVTEITPITMTFNSVVTNDVCGTKKGKIKGIQVTGGMGSGYSYEWTDSSNGIVATTDDIDNLAAGIYNLRVYDVNSCDETRATFTVLNDTNQPSAPIANDVQTCSPGNVVIAVNNPELGYQYKLFDTQLSTTPVATQANGKFTVNVSSARDYYLSRALGTCESERVKVHISLGVAAFDIPNTVTPNGDGINDLWLIPGLQNSTTTLVQVFNRSGAKVFESKGYAQPFNGRSNGKALPIGAYYYVINPGQGCKIFSGTLTIIR